MPAQRRILCFIFVRMFSRLLIHSSKNNETREEAQVGSGLIPDGVDSTHCCTMALATFTRMHQKAVAIGDFDIKG